MDKIYNFGELDLINEQHTKDIMKKYWYERDVVGQSEAFENACHSIIKVGIRDNVPDASEYILNL